MLRAATMSDSLAATRLAILLWSDNQFNELKAGIEKYLADKNALIIVCFDNDTPIGFAQCQLRCDYVEGTSSSPVGYLEGIYVDENYRKQGVAKQLLAYCEKWSKENGCVEFASDCELTNTDSFNFHMNVGFTEVNRIICFTKEI